MLDDELMLRVGMAGSWGELQEATVEAAHQLGFGMASGARIVGRLGSGKSTGASFGNTPDGLVEVSKSEDWGLRDPVLRGLLARPGFVQYDQSFYAAAGAGQIAEMIGQFGYRHGLAFAMHEPAHAEVFFFGLDGPDRLPSGNTAEIELRAMLQLLTLHAKTAASQIPMPGLKPPAPPAAALTAVEAECLRWEAAGAIWRAGEVCHLSDAEIAKRLASAANKLGASTSRGAAVLAIRRGLIEP